MLKSTAKFGCNVSFAYGHIFCLKFKASLIMFSVIKFNYFLDIVLIDGKIGF